MKSRVVIKKWQLHDDIDKIVQTDDVSNKDIWDIIDYLITIDILDEYGSYEKYEKYLERVYGIGRSKKDND